MASAFFRQFAIDNHLTVDYGYMYGKYRDFYISLKETIGSSKILNIITNLGCNKEKLKEVLSVFGPEELPKYCISDMKKHDNYLQFTFELPTNQSQMIVNFLNIFIDSYINCGLKVETLCPICHEALKEGEDIAIVDVGGILTPIHNACVEKGKQEAKQKAIEKNNSENGVKTGYNKGLLGAILFGLIYMGILIVLFLFVQFILSNLDGDNGNFALIFQYAPVFAALFACPIIYAGYDIFKGKKGTGKYIIILWTVIITTLVGTFLGFVTSLLLLDTGMSFLELMKLVGELIACKDIKGSTSFRWGFYIYIIVALGLSILSMVFKFSGKQEMEEANSETFEKLD